MSQMDQVKSFSFFAISVAGDAAAAEMGTSLMPHAPW
jgi:hypothetical protein